MVKKSEKLDFLILAPTPSPKKFTNLKGASQLLRVMLAVRQESGKRGSLKKSCRREKLLKQSL